MDLLSVNVDGWKSALLATEKLQGTSCTNYPKGSFSDAVKMSR